MRNEPPPRVPSPRRTMKSVVWTALAAFSGACAFAEEPPPPQIEDLYRSDLALEAVTLADGKSAFYIRQRIDEKTGRPRQSLWRVDAAGKAGPVEPGEPDVLSLLPSPDLKWLVLLSGRPFGDGTPAFEPVPSCSDPAADIWLLPVAGGPAIPLGGVGKPYGRVLTDKFYGRVAFSPDGTKLAFVADEGIDPRTEAERNNGVVVVRDDQGEGYEGYGPTQVWVADLAESPGKVAAAGIVRLTPGDHWYGDPQWAPDGSYVVCHANRNADQESVRYSVNHNYDLWKFSLADPIPEQLTFGPGPEFSPRLAPDGKRLVCLSSPRFQGPHMDVFNLLVVDLTAPPATARALFDHHGEGAERPPHLAPVPPLPDRCWLDRRRVWFNAHDGVASPTQAVDLDSGPAAVEGGPPPPAARSPLLPRNSPGIGPRLRAADEIVRWRSFDGLEIEGVLTRPPASVARPPFRLLVMPHGGPHHRATSGAGFDTQFFATRGYAVFQPNFRGSTGYGLRFLDANHLDLGGGDMRDILAGIDHLVAEGVADRERQFVYGVSYGGYMTAWLVGQTRQFRAAAAQNAVTDMNAMWHLSDLQSWTEYDLGGKPWEVPERMRERSPLTHAHKVRTPTLLLHATDDRRCPVAMGRMFHRALEENGVETQLVLYPGEGHPIKTIPHRADVLTRVFEWFERHGGAVDRR